MGRKVTGAVVGNRPEADLIVGMLSANGIQAWASTDDLGGMRPALTLQGVPVLVPAGSADDASRLIGGESSDPVLLNAFQRWVVRLLAGRPMPR